MLKTLESDTSSFKISDNETNISLTANKNGIYFVDKTYTPYVYIKQKNGGYIKNFAVDWGLEALIFHRIP